MKTKIKSLLIILGFVLLSVSKVSAQAGCFSNTIFTPTRTEVQSQNAILDFTLEPGVNPCNNSTGNNLTGVGINQVNPQYMLDILCNTGSGTNKDVNVTNATGFQNVGYRIGGNMMMWHDGDVSCLYLGAGAGFSLSSVSNRNNTFVGFNAGGTDGTSGGTSCTALGWSAGYSLSNQFANNNSFAGYAAGYTMKTGFDNTDFGYSAGYKDTNGAFNTFLGENAGYSTQGCNVIQYPSCNQEGDYNTMTGDRCGYGNISGQHNCYYGSQASNLNNGSYNCVYGHLSGSSGPNYDSNSYFGALSALSNLGNSNVIMGIQAGYNTGAATASNYNVFVGPYSAYTNPSGNYNVTLGYRADAYTGTAGSPMSINNAVAIGASAIVNDSNSIILGNNKQWTGIGLSYPVGRGYPNNSLEICSRTHTGATISNSSGLRFTNLTSTSTPVKNPGPGYLGLNSSGDVIYVDTAFGGNGLGIGYCAPAGSGLNTVVHSGGYYLPDSVNFYFAGNNSGSLTKTDVVIGNGCGYVPKAKLDILQNSSYTPPSTISSMGLYVENDDLQYGNTLPGQPVMGIESYIPAGSTQCRSIAGYFSAPGSCSGYDVNDAIIVPPNGGLVGIGTVSPGANLEVDGYSYNLGHTLINAATGWGNVALDVTSWLPFAGTQVGILSEVNNAQAPGYPNIAIDADADGLVSGVPNIGLYATGNNNPSIDYAGYFFGNVDIVGIAGCSSGYWSYSDSTIKTKVDSFSNALSIIKRLKPKTYYFDTVNSYHFKLDTFMRYGFIAQQVQRIVPSLVRTITTPAQIDTGGHVIVPSSTISTLDYEQFIPILTAAFQEQQQIYYNDSVKQKQTNDSLRSTLDSLRSAFKSYVSCLNSLCGSSGGEGVMAKGNSNSNNKSNYTLNTQNITLSGSIGDAPLLYQNIPNPFSSGTKINYYLPEGTMGATVVFYDMYGNMLKTVQLGQTGNGTLNITPDNLSNGIYSYSLIVNGAVIDTKKMLLQK